MDRLTQFFRSFRTLAFVGAFAVSMLPWPGLTSSAIADQVPVGGDTSLRSTWWNDYWVARPAFHALADVNGDGFADLIYTLTASMNTPQTNVYVQYSNGSSFGAPVIVATDSSTIVAVCDPDTCSSNAQALINAVGDVNGDGRPDILFADGTVALGNGSGFGPKTAWGGETSLRSTWWADYWVARPAFHALADVNGDGFADLIYTLTASMNTPQTNVYVQYSNGSSFGAPVIVATDSSTIVAVCDPDTCSSNDQALINAVGDVNGDGRPDILFADGTVALGNGSGFGPKTAWGGDTSLRSTWWADYWVARPAFHALADVNGDGFADLIYTLTASMNTPQTNVYVQYSNGSSFEAPVMVATDSSTIVSVCDPDTCSSNAQALINAVGDVNGDGQKDILFANGSVANLLYPFTVEPKFLIGSVIYVPPGQGPSKITYSDQTMTGTTVSTTDTWKYSSSAGVQIGAPLGSVTITFGNGFGGSSMTSVDMQQMTSTTFPYDQLAADAINHDFDQIQLFIGLNVNGLRDYLGKVIWSMDFSRIASNGFPPQGNFIQVGCLRGTFSAADCADQISILTQAQIISPADYAKILGADPFADPATAPATVDCKRYRWIPDAGFQYAFELGGSPITYMVTNNNSTTNANTTSYEYSVDIKASGGFIVSGIFNNTLNGSATFTWTHSSTTTNKTGTTKSSSLFLSEPSNLYAGPKTIYVYEDTIFKTFMFSFVTPPPPNQPCM